MSNTKGTSLLAQTEEKTKKWGGDIFNYDIKGVIKDYDSNLAKYNDPATTQADKDAINALYGGDITKWDNKNAYTSYMDDLNEVRYIDSLNNAYTASMDAAKDAEQRKTQYVDTRRMLMQKYLPDTLQAQGLANTGYVADTLLKAENNYNQYLLGAMNERAQTEQNAMQSYQDALGTYKQQQANTAYERFLQEQAKTEAKTETNNQNKAALIGAIDEGADIGTVEKQAEILGLDTSTVDELKAYEAAEKEKEQETLFNTYKNTAGSWTKEGLAADKDAGLLTKEQHDELLIKYYMPENTYIGGDVKATNYMGTSGNGRDLMYPAEKNDGFTVNLNGKEYVLKTGDTVPKDSDVYKFAMSRQEIADGQVFMYDGELYVQNRLSVQRIKDARGYEDVLAYMKGK